MSHPPLHELLDPKGVVKHDVDFEHRERRNRRDKLRKLRVLRKRAGAVACAGVGAACGAAITCLYTGAYTDRLVQKTLAVLIGGPLAGLWFALILKIYVSFAFEGTEASEQDRAFTEGFRRPLMRFVPCAGPLVVAAIVFDARWDLALDSLIGTIIGAYAWKLFCKRRGDDEAFE